jgi:hypothetical protein
LSKKLAKKLGVPPLWFCRSIVGRL